MSSDEKSIQAARRIASAAARRPKAAMQSATILASCIAAALAILAALSVAIAQDPADWRAFGQASISAAIVALSAILGRVRQGGGQPIARRAQHTNNEEDPS